MLLVKAYLSTQSVNVVLVVHAKLLITKLVEFICRFAVELHQSLESKHFHNAQCTTGRCYQTNKPLENGTVSKT